MPNWTKVPVDTAAAEWVWVPPGNYSRDFPNPPERWVQRVRDLLSTGEYQLLVASGGHLSFVGTPAECDARAQQTRE